MKTLPYPIPQQTVHTQPPCPGHILQSPSTLNKINDMEATIEVLFTYYKNTGEITYLFLLSDYQSS